MFTWSPQTDNNIKKKTPSLLDIYDVDLFRWILILRKRALFIFFLLLYKKDSGKFYFWSNKGCRPLLQHVKIDPKLKYCLWLMKGRVKSKNPFNYNLITAKCYINMHLIKSVQNVSPNQSCAGCVRPYNDLWWHLNSNENILSPALKENNTELFYFSTFILANGHRARTKKLRCNIMSRVFFRGLCLSYQALANVSLSHCFFFLELIKHLNI